MAEKGSVISEKIGAKTERLATKPEKLATKPEKLATKPEKLATKPEKLASKPEKLATKPEKLVAKTETLATNTEMLVTKTEKLEAVEEEICLKDSLGLLEGTLDDDTVNVFTHSTTGFPGAWGEEEISSLLHVWRDVVERYRARRVENGGMGGRYRKPDFYNMVLQRLKRVKGFRGTDHGERLIDKDAVRDQMKTLRTEYDTYQGLCKIPGFKTVRPPCVDEMDKIFKRYPGVETGVARRQRISSESGNVVDGVSEDSDHSHRLSLSYDKENALNNEGQPNADEMLQNRKFRFQRRISLQKLFRIVTAHQQTMVDTVQKIFQSLEASNARMVTLMEDLVTAQKGTLLPKGN